MNRKISRRVFSASVAALASVGLGGRALAAQDRPNWEMVIGGCRSGKTRK